MNDSVGVCHASPEEAVEQLRAPNMLSWSTFDQERPEKAHLQDPLVEGDDVAADVSILK